MLTRQLGIVGFSLALSGCFAETETAFEMPTIVMFSGVYESSSNDSSLVFNNGRVEYRTIEGNVSRMYRVEGDLINIQPAASSKETRDDLVMRIQDGGKFLTCNMCAGYLMSNVWKLSAVQPE